MLRILVDSSADYDVSELKEVECVYCPILFGEEPFDMTSSKSAFFEKLMTSEFFPKTSTPSLQTFIDIFEDVKNKGDQMIYLVLSSGLSSTYQNACLASSMVEYDEIYVIDSKSVTVNIQILADYAVALRKEGKSAKEIAAILEEAKTHTGLVAMADTLEYLSKGGRLSKGAAAIGELANIKPVVTMDKEGKCILTQTALGKIKAFSIIEKALEKYEINEDFPLYVIYAYDRENGEKLASKLEKAGIKVTGIKPIGGTIGSHIGPGATGVVFMEKF